MNPAQAAMELCAQTGKCHQGYKGARPALELLVTVRNINVLMWSGTRNKGKQHAIENTTELQEVFEE